MACSPAQAPFVAFSFAVCLSSSVRVVPYQQLHETKLFQITVVCEALASLLCLSNDVGSLWCVQVQLLTEDLRQSEVFVSPSTLKSAWCVKVFKTLVLKHPLTVLINSNHILCFELNQLLITELQCLRFNFKSSVQ